MAIIHIPTTPEIRKFVLHQHRDQVYYRTDRASNEPVIKLNLKMLLGNMIACLMNDDLTHFKPQKRPPVYLTFEVSKRFDQCWLTEEKAKRISLHLDRYFKDDFCKYVDFCVSFGLEVERALEQYRENYDISEDDYSFDTMRSYYYRYGKKTIMMPDRRYNETKGTTKQAVLRAS